MKDEQYILYICDEILGETSIKQHKFNYLLGDLHKNGKSRTKLPVDAYYKKLNIVIEYMERQHSETIKHFDKPTIMTVSRVNRGEQRKIYDRRREEILPKHGIKLIKIHYSDFNYDSNKRIIRDLNNDKKILQKLLNKQF